MKVIKEYDAKVDNKKRLTIRGAKLPSWELNHILKIEKKMHTSGSNYLRYRKINWFNSQGSLAISL